MRHARRNSVEGLARDTDCRAEGQIGESGPARSTDVRKGDRLPAIVDNLATVRQPGVAQRLRRDSDVTKECEAERPRTTSSRRSAGRSQPVTVESALVAHDARGSPVDSAHLLGRGSHSFVMGGQAWSLLISARISRANRHASSRLVGPTDRRSGPGCRADRLDLLLRTAGEGTTRVSGQVWVSPS